MDASIKRDVSNTFTRREIQLSVRRLIKRKLYICRLQLPEAVLGDLWHACWRAARPQAFDPKSLL